MGRIAGDEPKARFGWLFPCLVLAFVSLTPDGVAQVRTWTDTDGKTIEAELLEKTDSTLTIRRADGQVFTFPLTRLSPDDREFVVAWSPPELPTPSAVEDALLLIQTPDGSGSGFVAQMGGRAYVVTNQHVIAGAEAGQIVIRDLRGNQIVVDRLEVSASQDLARFPIAPRPALKLTRDVSLDAPVIAYGNSQGAGVTTIGRGKVLGLAVDRFETDAEIVPGNSGGPVIDGAGNVVGVSTYVARLADDDDWTEKGTRYAKARRFALRPAVVTDWTPVEWGIYVAQARRIEQARVTLKEAWQVAATIVRSPGSAITDDGQSAAAVREVIRMQNEHARRIRQHDGDSVRGQNEVDRRNQSLNASHRAKLNAIIQLLEKEAIGIELIPPRLTLPYLLSEAGEIRQDAERLRARLTEAMKIEHTFFRLSSPRL